LPATVLKLVLLANQPAGIFYFIFFSVETVGKASFLGCQHVSQIFLFAPFLSSTPDLTTFPEQPFANPGRHTPDNRGGEAAC
jgi:hypothetical protein